ncbi:MAG: TIGR02300 family protein [Acetobacteraceae bacterium]|nr:TIGR02300 family protein [Acetobacteraceae bacterium]
MTLPPGSGMARPLLGCDRPDWHQQGENRRRLYRKRFESEMAKPELGTKRTCVNDGVRFYDLNKVPAVCPKCGTEQPQEQPRLRRAGGNVLEDKRLLKKVPAPGLEDAETDVEVADDEESEDVLEDTSDLEDEADPIGADIEVEPESDEKDM